MKVLIDDGLTSLYKLTGIGQHSRNVYTHLKDYCLCDMANYRFFRGVPRVLRKYSYETFINIHSLYSKYDIIHYQDHNIPMLSGRAKRVVTIHDLSVFRFPETVPFIYIKHNQKNIKHAVKNADAIITPSEFTKEEIKSYFSWVNTERIFSCESGLRDIFFEKNVESKVLEKHRLEEYNYLFFLGSISKRKNLKFLLTSFIKAKREGAVKKGLKLVLAGQNWWGAGSVKDLIDPQYGIITTGYLTDDDIVQLYRNSRAVVFPSIYEGFGSPIIEAMSQNVPLIISRIPTSLYLNKRHGNRMLTFNLDDEKGLVDTMSDLDSNYDEIVKELNYGDISRYNYNYIARNHYEVYKSLI